MIRSTLGISLIALTSCAAFGQSASTPSFDVASIKPAAPMQNGMIRVGMGGDPGRVNYTNVTLKNILTRAYGVKAHQITGPAWLDSERFDVIATVPDGVPKEQIPVMLQNLLAERFKMQTHKETKDANVYALIVGKGGPKLTAAKEDDGGEAPRGGPVMVGPDGKAIARPQGAMMMIRNDGGASHMDAKKVTLSAFCDMLSNFLDRPVLDMTEIKGQYDVTLDIAAEDLVGMKGAMAGARIAVAGGPVGHEAGPRADSPAPESAPGASIFAAVQSLGLKLDPRKSPMDYIVIDKAEKVPTEN
jgi:uncharacterized protein (TIGR03435 family)